VSGCYCENCKQYIEPDWKEKGIFKFSKETLFTQEILRDYLNSFLQGRTTFHAYYSKSVLCEPLFFPGYDTLRAGLSTFVSKLKFQEDQEFTCAKCDKTPKVVLFDATLLACRKDWAMIEDLLVNGAIVDVGSKFSTRNLLPTKKLLEKLKGFATSTSLMPLLNETFETFLGEIDLIIKDFLESIAIKNHEVK